MAASVELAMLSGESVLQGAGGEQEEQAASKKAAREGVGPCHRGFSPGEGCHVFF